MSKTCLIHIGPAKTGTTAIQASFARNASALARHGILYPALERNHRFLVSSVMTTPEAFSYNFKKGRKGAAIEQYHAGMRRRFEDEVAASDCPLVLLSSEHCGLLDAPEIQRLAAYLAGHFMAVRIVLFARNPIYHVPSLVQERVKNGAGRLADALTNVPFFRYSRAVPIWQSAFGQEAVEVLKYPGDPPDRGSVVDALLDHLGIAERDAFQTEKANTSLSGAALLLADAASEFAPKTSGQRYLQKYLTRIEGPSYRLPRETRDRVVARSNAQLDYLSAEWGIDFEVSDPGDDDGARDFFPTETLASLARLVNDLAKQAEAVPPSARKKKLSKGRASR